MIINGHGHLLPTPEEIPSFMRQKKFFWVDDERQFMHQGNWRRPITDPSFFLDQKIEWMQQSNIDHEVVLTLSQLYCNGLSQRDTLDIIRFQNDFNASVQSKYPEKFTTGFVVQPAFLEQALAELERCVEQHHLKMLCLSTHYLSSQGEWLSVADKSVEPLWELANHFGIAIQIHPYDAGRMVSLKDQYWRNHLVWMMAQTADTYLMFSMLGFAQRYPKVRTCFAHGNMLGQANYGRVVQGIEGRPDLFLGAQHPKETKGAKNVFFDTLVHDTDMLGLMVKRCGSKQLVWGVDDPYPLGEMDTVEGCYPGIFLDQAVKQGVVSERDKTLIKGQNARRWLDI